MLTSCYQKNIAEAGCDEAGRGSLAGPVFAAAVILPANFSLPQLNDSKLLSEKKRNSFREIIEEKALAWAIGIVDEKEIDTINIRNASVLAMHRALETLKVQPEYILVDGNFFKNFRDIPHKCFVKGDGIYMSIAAASVLAKTHRDDFMKKLHEEFPEYAWNKNKGYATKEHIARILTAGHSKYHRRSFHLHSAQLSIPFS
jgi:ribonuclease HII